MGLLGSLLALPPRVLNAPVRAVEDLLSGGPVRDDDRVFSRPLDALADQLERVDEPGPRV